MAKGVRLHPLIERLLGLIELPDGLIDDVLTRVRTRCANEDLAGLSRPKAQARLELAACEAILATFQDYHPRKALKAKKTWPWAHVVLIGNRATIELWIGHDYADEDGLEPFDMVVHRPAKKALRPKHEPELQLRMQAPAPSPPEPQKASSGLKAMLDARKSR